MLYIDTSALVKIVQMGPESQALLAYLETAGPVATSALSDVELMRAAHRKDKQHVVQARAVLDRLPIIGISAPILRTAGNLLPGTHLRTLDAIHLAIAMTLPSLSYICTYDLRMIDSAELLGLTCVSPT